MPYLLKTQLQDAYKKKDLPLLSLGKARRTSRPLLGPWIPLCSQQQHNEKVEYPGFTRPEPDRLL